MPLDDFMGRPPRPGSQRPSEDRDKEAPAAPVDAIAGAVHSLEADFQSAQEARDPEKMASAILELDRIIWKTARDPENAELIPQGRAVLREWMALMAAALASTPRRAPDGLEPLVEEILKLRNEMRRQKRWADADLLRACLQRAGVMVEDTDDGARWRVAGEG
jgi:cysteinyl-tRNA synthetase